MRSNDSLLFFKEALKRFRTHGSLLPSSRFLAKRVLRCIPRLEAPLLIELGAGTGALTKGIVQTLPKKGRLVIVEVNSTLAGHLKRSFDDPRVTVIEADARELPELMRRRGLPKADCIVSGLPLGDFGREEREGILMAISESLASQGSYIQFQYFLSSLAHIRQKFSVKIAGFELLNIPPAFLYTCRKKATIRA